MASIVFQALPAGSGGTWAPPLEEYVPREPAITPGGGRKTIQGTPLWGKRVAYNLQLAPGGTRNCVRWMDEGERLVEVGLLRHFIAGA